MSDLVYRSWGVFLISVAACTTILGDDFEIEEATNSNVAPSSVATGMGGETSTGGSGGMPSTGGNPSTGGSAGENCTNNVDDDDDQLLDCGDPDCVGGGQGPFACIPSVPASWTGPVTLSEVPHLDPKPTCPTSYPDESYNGVFNVHANAVTCGNCTCPSSNPTCTPAGIGHYVQANCQNLPYAGTNQVGGCVVQGAYSGTISVRIGNPSASVTCTPQGGGVTNTPPVLWDTDSRVCLYAGELGGGCAGQEVCAPITGGGMFSDQICIFKAGDEICPAPFSNKIVYSDSANDFNDTRGCSSCGCMQQSASCSVNTQFFSSSNCGGSPVFTIANNNNCNSSNINGLYARAVITGGPSGSCSVTQQANPQGTVTETGPFTTVCCL